MTKRNMNDKSNNGKKVQQPTCQVDFYSVCIKIA